MIDRLHLRVEPGMRFGAPHIRGASAESVAGPIAAGDSVDATARDFGIERAEALLCCWFMSLYGAKLADEPQLFVRTCFGTRAPTCSGSSPAAARRVPTCFGPTPTARTEHPPVRALRHPQDAAKGGAHADPPGLARPVAVGTSTPDGGLAWAVAGDGPRAPAGPPPLLRSAREPDRARIECTRHWLTPERWSRKKLEFSTQVELEEVATRSLVEPEQLRPVGPKQLRKITQWSQWKAWGDQHYGSMARGDWDQVPDPPGWTR